MLSRVVLHRLAGAFVLLLLIAIFWIVVFDQAGLKNRQTSLIGHSVANDFDTATLFEQQSPNNGLPTNDAAPAAPNDTRSPSSQRIVPDFPDSASQSLQSESLQPDKQIARIDYGAQGRPSLEFSSNTATPLESVDAMHDKDLWELRVGTFSQKKNAITLKQSLVADLPEVTAYIREIDGRNGKLYIVFLGSWARRQEGERIQQLVEFRHNLRTALRQKDKTVK